MDWLNDDYGFDGLSGRTIENDVETSLHSISPYKHLADKYSDFYVSFDRQRIYAVFKESGGIIEVPASEWMEPEQYRDFLAAGCPEQEVL
jgi:hypothetical protein